ESKHLYLHVALPISLESFPSHEPLLRVSEYFSFSLKIISKKRADLENTIRITMNGAEDIFLFRLAGSPVASSTWHWHFLLKWFNVQHSRCSVINSGGDRYSESNIKDEILCDTLRSAHWLSACFFLSPLPPANNFKQKLNVILSSNAPAAPPNR